MGAKTWMLVYSDGHAKQMLRNKPPLDRAASAALAARLFPGVKPQTRDGDLSYTNPPDDEVLVGCFPGVSVVAAIDLAIDRPSELPPEFLAAELGPIAQLHVMHSVSDWFAYAIWDRGKLVRSLSVSPDVGILEDIGARLPFEEPFWSGEHPATDPEEEKNDYPLPFHPLELGEETLKELFGYQLEGFVDPTLLEPETVPLYRFKR